MKRQPRDIILFSTADWDNPFWTNKQHVAMELARLGYRIFYMESVGLRQPSVKAQDLGRIKARLARLKKPVRQVHENIWVWSPFVLPLQKYGIVRAFNSLMLKTCLRWFMRKYDFKPDVLWTYNPLTTRFLNSDRFGEVVYHCVDDIKEQPGMPREVLEAGEGDLLHKAGTVFATARKLEESCRRINDNTHYHSNVADYDHFSLARDKDTKVPEFLRKLEGPVIGFVGAVSGYKVDFDLIREAAKMHPDWNFVLMGKVGEGCPWSDDGGLEAEPNIHLPGPVDYSELPAHLKGVDVAMIPATLNPYTESMFPMKFYEYLAAGKPVVCTDLPALREVADATYLAKGAADFVTGIEKALAGELDPDGLGERLARSNTYTTRTRAMLDILGWQAPVEK